MLTKDEEEIVKEWKTLPAEYYADNPYDGKEQTDFLIEIIERLTGKIY